ncbi:MAG: (2Fe-2S)-binding protein [Rhodanobacter sp.]|uniref:Rieske 2Fe-2S domain-containing protein n=1 Tax=Rhodanobacter glycinis TaxID=582702 RepID=A0A5B9DUT0_9GAMM|nr:Rieske 2Fe-2S domain-containing protein [Rhodanobacter glycinis]QEE23392.1 Rieske 2Fe-2S domain-containing protein [Rhodanobacter glycinis]TAM26069.1 MAG: (2Fe-2S)-binding protein [Rhodanobacter sp.]
MATSKDYRLGEFTFPRGWFMVAEASELDTFKPLAVHFFGKEFALYRGRETGRVVLLDAYCPHMGTHLAAPNSTSYVYRDNMGTNIEGDCIRCPYHAWRFGPDGKCNEIPYHEGPIPPTASVKSWTVVESLGAIWVWHDPEGGEPEWEHPSVPQWSDPAWVHPKWDHLGLLKQHPQEVIDNIADYAHLGPIHGSTVTRYENEFRGHTAIQRQAGGHRTLVGAEGSSPELSTVTTYHGPGCLISVLTGMYEAVMLIAHTPMEDGTIKVWHSLLVKSASGSKVATQMDAIAAAQFQDTALQAFQQDIEIWSNKAPCINGLFLPDDGAFMKSRIWYKQFYNPRAKKQDYLERCEGYFVPKGVAPFAEHPDE